MHRIDTAKNYDVVIIGGGIAGLSVALRLPPTMRVALVSKGPRGEGNTRYAQGGVAAALGDDDSPHLHLQDTLAAGAGLSDEQAARLLVEEARTAMRWLIEMGVQFDRAEGVQRAHLTADGLLLGREAAHSRWRILHARGDATGAEIERALLAALSQRPELTVYEDCFVSELLVRDGRCCGLQAVDRDGALITLAARHIVLASGGAGSLWGRTSNPSCATADGLALAWQAGAELADLEFMQFHPTVLVTAARAHLISEAVRGEGAHLRNHAGERFMLRYSEQAELAPRDVVARALLSEMLAEGTACQYLDLRHLPAEQIHARFPTISATCRRYGYDLAADLLPVAPAAHYCMGGVLVDALGRTAIPGLFAVGEVACTGIHGANRLASNSLLEGLVAGLRTADVIGREQDIWSLSVNDSLREATRIIPYQLASEEIPGAHALTPEQVRQRLQQTMWRAVSLVREGAALGEARATIRGLRPALQRSAAPEDRSMRVYRAETLNMLLVAELVIAAALERRESRGSHYRRDYPSCDETLTGLHFALRPAD
ncbi:MAG TPA: L-aspartate oxidase [Ktedonobacteraceae bacterium]|nr:L-aspartate oxidase [Ktedonobacteraceae bacterium]